MMLKYNFKYRTTTDGGARVDKKAFQLKTNRPLVYIVNKFEQVLGVFPSE